jgi:hypothetical protein
MLLETVEGFDNDGQQCRARSDRKSHTQYVEAASQVVLSSLYSAYSSVHENWYLG